MNRAAGFTIVEVVIAMAIMAAVVGAVFGLLDPAHGMHQAQHEISDLQQRLRVAVDSLHRDLIAAGAGTGRGDGTASLLGTLAPVIPYRTGELRPDPARGVYYRRDAITLLTVPPAAARAAIDEGTPIGSTELHINTQLDCGPLGHNRLCGFAQGMHVIVFDASGAWDLMRVTRVETPTLYLQHRGSRSANAYTRGAAVAQVDVHTYYLETDTRAGTYQLKHYDGFDSDMPAVDDVVDLQFEYFGDPEPPRIRQGAAVSDRDLSESATTYGPTPPPPGIDRRFDTWPEGENCTFGLVDGEHVPRLPVLAPGPTAVPLLPSTLQDGPWCPDAEYPDRFDADLLRIRRIRVRLRLQVASAALRGPAGTLFTRGGTATAGHRLVPDQELEFDVTPRNMTAGRE